MKIEKKWKPTLAYYTDEELIEKLNKQTNIYEDNKEQTHGQHTTDDTIRPRNATISERNSK